MAASSMTARSLTHLTRFSRTLLFPRSHSRYCTSSAKTEKASEAAEATKEKTESGGEHPLTDVEKKLQAEKVELNEKLKDVTDKYKRALAEVENVRKRMNKQVEDTKMFGIQGFCKDLLEVADILDQATGTVPAEEMEKNQHLKSLFEGMAMTNTQLLKVFSKHGLTKVAPEIGEKFDPNFHEALFQVPAPEGKEDGTVAILEKSGYKLHNRTLRPALVGVFSGSS